MARKLPNLKLGHCHPFTCKFKQPPINILLLHLRFLTSHPMTPIASSESIPFLLRFSYLQLARLQTMMETLQNSPEAAATAKPLTMQKQSGKLAQPPQRRRESDHDSFSHVSSDHSDEQNPNFTKSAGDAAALLLQCLPKNFSQALERSKVGGHVSRNI
jgi:hypothetical protein